MCFVLFVRFKSGRHCVVIQVWTDSYMYRWIVWSETHKKVHMKFDPIRVRIFSFVVDKKIDTLVLLTFQSRRKSSSNRKRVRRKSILRNTWPSNELGGRLATKKSDVSLPVKKSQFFVILKKLVTFYSKNV